MVDAQFRSSAGACPVDAGRRPVGQAQGPFAGRPDGEPAPPGACRCASGNSQQPSSQDGLRPGRDRRQRRAQAVQVVARVQRGEDELRRVAVVLGEATGGEVGVARLRRLHEASVLLGAQVPLAGVQGALGEAVALGVVEALRDELDDALARRRGELRVERAVRGAQPAPVALAHVVLHLGHEALELREVRRLQGGDGDAQRDDLEGDAADVQRLGVVGRQIGDPHPPVGLGDDEALALQEPQRLADRRAPRAERLTERDLGRDLPRGHVAAQDRLAHARVDVRDVLAVPGDHPIACGGHRGARLALASDRSSGSTCEVI